MGNISQTLHVWHSYIRPQVNHLNVVGKYGSPTECLCLFVQNPNNIQLSTVPQFPDTPCDCHRTADQLGWCQGGQLIGIYGSPMECLGLGVPNSFFRPFCGDRNDRATSPEASAPGDWRYPGSAPVKKGLA